MAKNPAIDELAKLVKELQSERQAHVAAIARIDDTFKQFGISAQATGGAAPTAAPRRGRRKKTTRRAKATSQPAKRGRPVGSKKKRGRRSFKQTGEESVAAFVAQHGNPSTKEVNEHWRKEGRGGKADNTLGKLIQQGKIKRVPVKGERGSRYKTA